MTKQCKKCKETIDYVKYEANNVIEYGEIDLESNFWEQEGTEHSIRSKLTFFCPQCGEIIKFTKEELKKFL